MVKKSNKPPKNKATDTLPTSHPVEVITQEELDNIKKLQNNSVQLTTLTENTYNKAKLAKLEAENFILQMANKYKLDLHNGDNITDTGEIIRKERLNKNE